MYQARKETHCPDNDKNRVKAEVEGIAQGHVDHSLNAGWIVELGLSGSYEVRKRSLPGE